MYYCYNAEYLFYPVLRDAHDRRDAGLSRRRAARCDADLCGRSLCRRSGRHPDAVSLEDAHLDRSGYYALARNDAAITATPRNGSWISLAGCAGAMKSMSPRRAARSTGSRCFGRHRADPARGPHVLRRGIQYLRLPVAPQPDGGDLLVPHRQGAEAKPRQHLRYRHVQVAQLDPFRMAFAAVAGSWADGTGAVVLR